MTTILTKEEILYKIKRIAYQIYEENIDEEEFILAGIHGNGYELAKLLQRELQEICPPKITLCQVFVNKKQPIDEVTTSIESETYRDKSVVVVDDVLNSGATLIYAVKHFLQEPLKQLKTAVLVDRSHKKYPIKADFKGMSLSTTLEETVEVTLNGDIKAVIS